MKSLLAAGALAALFMGAAVAQAQETTTRAGFLVRADMEFGGDDLVTVDFEEGDSQDIKAGQGVAVGVGGWFRPVENNPFELHATVGFKYTTTAAENADINVSRMVLRLDALYRFENDWFATFGVVHHSSPELDGDGFFEDIRFDDSTGFNVGVGWKWISLNYTDLTYSSPFYEDVDAGSIGVAFAYRFGASN